MRERHTAEHSEGDIPGFMRTAMRYTRSITDDTMCTSLLCCVHSRCVTCCIRREGECTSHSDRRALLPFSLLQHSACMYSPSSTPAAHMDRTAATVSMLAAHVHMRSSAVVIHLSFHPSLHWPSFFSFLFILLFSVIGTSVYAKRFNRSDSRSTFNCRRLKSKDPIVTASVEETIARTAIHIP